MQKSQINVNVFVSRRKEWGTLAVLLFLLCLMLDFHRIGLQGFYSASYKCHCFKKNPSFSTHNNVCMTVYSKYGSGSCLGQHSLSGLI